MRSTDLIELLNDAELPVTASAHDYRSRLGALFAEYFRAVRALRGMDYPSRTVRHEAHLIEAVGTHLLDCDAHLKRGNPGAALLALSQSLNACAGFLHMLESVDLDADVLRPAYRVRSGVDPIPPRKYDMFHIPFEKRSRVRAQRYSVPGVPCLYLGRSLYACWEELGHPKPEDSWVCAVGLRRGEKVKVLNFGYRPALMAAMLNHHGLPARRTKRGDLAVAYAIVWPLIAACSAERHPRSSGDEYAIPQLLLRWLIDRREFLGIRYFSTRVFPYDVSLSAQNYVFPTVSALPSGHCKILTQKFELSDPVCVADAMASHQPPLSRFRDEVVEAPSGAYLPYQQSPYARAEALLETLPRSPL